jgi:predicted GNAT family acetyltransferase
MNVREYFSATNFLEAAGSLLQSDEVRFSLLYGIARRVAVNPHYYGEENPWFCIVADNTAISALAWRTPPHLVGLAWSVGDAAEAVSLLIESVHQLWPSIPGVTGHREVTDSFAEKWSTTLKTPIQSVQSQRIYRLDSINNIPQTPGQLRLATLLDKEFIYRWTIAFGIDTNQESDRDIAERHTSQRIEHGDIYLWEIDGQSVSMAAKNRPTDHGMAVGLVYTPPELRRKGYATCCVAAVCREILKSGFDFCTLYTDLSNPTSNSIYMKIGFRPICDSSQYTFSIADQT